MKTLAMLFISLPAFGVDLVDVDIATVNDRSCMTVIKEAEQKISDQKVEIEKLKFKLKDQQIEIMHLQANQR